MNAPALLRALLLFATVALTACSGGREFAGECQSPADCPTGSTCRISGADAVGVCVCRSDEACGEGEICNSQGICQARSACRSNAECPADRYCNLASGDCIERVKCGTDVHCLPGTVCDPNGSQGCVPGCADTGDCPLYSACVGAGNGVLGECRSGVCDDKSFCAYGEFCEGNRCVSATDPNFCKECGQNVGCGDPANFCLINSSYDPNRPENGGPNFCGVSCEGEQDCPSGYNCGGVVLLTQDQCTQDTECGGGGRRCVLGEGSLRGACTCVDDQDCVIDSFPPACQGSCGGLGIQECTSDSECITTCEFRCAGTGTSCAQDSDCPALPLCGDYAGVGVNVCGNAPSTRCNTSEDCLCVQGQCAALRGRACTTAADCVPPCVGGGCQLGAACAPVEGLLCPDVR